jgi:hypothetical protein
LVDGLGTDEFVIQVEFDLWGLRIDLHLDGLTFPTSPVPALPCGPNAPGGGMYLAAITVGLTNSKVNIPSFGGTWGGFSLWLP